MTPEKVTRAMPTNVLISAYRYHRIGSPPRAALIAARADVASGVERHASASVGWNPEHKGARYVDSLYHAGLRFAGFADEIIDRVGHKGWHADSDQGEVNGTYRGAVFQIPGNNGRNRYFAGYTESLNRGYVIDVSSFTEGFRGNMYDPVKDHMAKLADRFAETCAERERDYQQAWEAGNRYAELHTELGAAIASRRSLQRDLNRARKIAKATGIAVPPSICAAVRAQIDTLLSQSTRLAGQMRDLLTEWSGNATFKGAAEGSL